MAAGGRWFDPRHPQQLNILWGEFPREILSLCEKLPRVENAYRTTNYVGHSESVYKGGTRPDCAVSEFRVRQRKQD